MDDALETLRVFANSANNLLVFEALSEDVTTSSTLAERTGASRSTVARILDEGQSRGWIDSEGSHYELTTKGEIITTEVRGWLQTIQGIQHLGKAVDWLPEPAHSLDYRYFRDADLITGSPSNPTEPFDFVSEMIRSATTIRTLAWTGVPRLTELINEQATAGKLDCEVVMQADFVNTLAERPEVAAHWQPPAERGEVWSFEGDVPISIHVIDETVVIWLDERHGDELVVQGALVTEDSAVRSWAESLYEDYRDDAVQIDPATLTTR